MLKYKRSSKKVTDCAFVTFGVLADKSQIYNAHLFANISEKRNCAMGKVKSISVVPVWVKFARMVAATQIIF